MANESENANRTVLCFSKMRKLTKKEYLRRAEKQRVMEEELESKMKMRDISLSVRKSVESEERVILGSSSVMLSLVSDYFEAMFEGDSQRGESIELSAKITADGIRAIHALALGVLSKVQVSRDNLAALIAAAQYCDVPALSQLCNEFVNRFDLTRDASVMAQMITDLDHLGFPHLADEWLNKVPSHLMSDLFLDENSIRMDCDLFSSILRKDTLEMDESEIWFRCAEWAAYQASVHSDEAITHLNEVKPLIRFPLMSEVFLLKEVMPTKLLSEIEFVAVRSVKYQLLDDSSIFCSSDPRRVTQKWDLSRIISNGYSVSENGSILSHSGRCGWSTAFVNGSIRPSGASTIEFEQINGQGMMYGVLEATQKPENNEMFGYPLKGVALYSFKGQLYYPSGHKPFGQSVTNGDRIKLTVTFTDSCHATLTFHKNGVQIGHDVQLDNYLDCTQGLRFAVQTRSICSLRICQ